jgi:hypothetical protein
VLFLVLELVSDEALEDDDVSGTLMSVGSGGLPRFTTVSPCLELKVLSGSKSVWNVGVRGRRCCPRVHHRANRIIR